MDNITETKNAILGRIAEIKNARDDKASRIDRIRSLVAGLGTAPTLSGLLGLLGGIREIITEQEA